LGRRIAKKVDGVIVEKYLWQGLTRLLAVYDGNNALLMRFRYADGRMPVAMIKGGVTYYLGYDQVGSLRVVTDTSGNVVKQVDYDSFGNIITDSDAAFAVPFGFAGGLHDRDTGMVKFGYRNYDPEIGRWTAKDPIGFAGGDIDLYGYVQNDPVNWIDPNGRDRTSWGGFGRSITDGPKNGNWGGQCWSGGQASCGRKGMGDAPPTDSADECYMEHDIGYEACENDWANPSGCRSECNKDLVQCLEKLPGDPRDWPNPPRKPESVIL
jgi:RHS repeat-associated protein